MTILALAAVTIGANAQEFSKEDKSALDAAYYPSDAVKRKFEKDAAKQKAAEPKIRVLYSRPLKKEREIFGELVKFDKMWRLGANESTEVLFLTDVTVGGKQLKAGRYTMHAIPKANEWTIKFSTDLDLWGSYSYDEANDVASVTVPTAKSADVIEALSIALYSPSANLVHIKIGWDTTVVEIPVTLN